MKLKSLLIAGVLMLAATVASAQSSRKKHPDYPVDPRGMFVELSGGVNTKIDPSGVGGFAPAFNVNIGKMFGVFVGMRFGMSIGSGMPLEGDEGWLLGEGKFSQKNFSLDFTWDILNTLNPDLFFLPFKLYPFLRANFYLLNNGPLSEGHYALTYGLGGGLRMAYSFSERWGIYADAAEIVTPAKKLRDTDGWVSLPTASLGVFVNFGF